MEEFFNNELVEKFESMIQEKEEFYFDSEELEEIIIHYLELGDLVMAQSAIDFGLKLHPDSSIILVKLLELQIEQEKYVEAKKLIIELEESSSETTDYLTCCAKYYSNLGNPKRAIMFCKKAIALGDELNFLNNFIGDEYVNLEDPFLAIKYYKAALEADPTDGYPLSNIMYCYISMKKYDDALVFINDYLDRFSFSENAWFEYGQLFYTQKKYKEAIKGFNYVLAINDSAVNVYSSKAACYEALKDYKKAIEIYEEMLPFEYTKSYTYYKIGLANKKLKQWIPALVAFQKSNIEDPQFYLALMEQSHIYENMGLMKESLHFAKEATFLNEDDIDFQKRLAFLLIDAGKLEESLVCLKKLVTEEPKRFYNWYAFAEVLMLLGEYEEAIVTLNLGLISHPRAELFYQMSNCYFNLKDQKAGKKYLDIAISLDASLEQDMGEKYPMIKS